MSTLTVQDILDNVGDLTGNYNTGTEDPDAKIRAINRSIEYFKRKIGFPCDEVIQTFYFSADQLFYDLNDNFDESIKVLYHNPQANIPSVEWNYYNYPDILRDTGESGNSKYSFTTINGRKQLVMFGSNLMGGQVLYNFDTIDGWVASGDASNLAVDEFQKYNGTASLSFDIVNSTGTATLSVSDLSQDFENLFTKNGYIKFWTWMSDNNIDDVTLKLKTDNSNYYSITVDTTDEGNDFTENGWIKLGFAANDAVTVGTPDVNNITSIQIDYDLGVGFTSATDFRIDYMFLTYPDQMDLIYYSSDKGTDTTGVTTKQILTTASDIVKIGDFFYDYVDLIARKAALNLYPQLRGDKEWYSTYVADLNDAMKTMSRIFPKKRTMINTYKHKIKRTW